jgi:gliding motility-associated-like protein
MHKILISVCDDGLPVLCSTIVVNLDIAKEEIFPFEAISPNGDNLNDFWMIQGIEHYPNNSVFLFDRWNNLVFSIENYNNSDRIWKGETNNGLSKSDVKDGTYFYKITLSPNGEVLSGTVVVKR